MYKPDLSDFLTLTSLLVTFSYSELTKYECLKFLDINIIIQSYVPTLKNIKLFKDILTSLDLKSSVILEMKTE